MTLKIYSLTSDHKTDLCSAASSLRTWQNSSIELSIETHLGYVYEGHPSLVRRDGTEYILHPGMYFCLPDRGYLKGEFSAGLVITFPQYRGMFSIGGAIESSGRFAYIDGGTNSLLIPPVQCGDPCLNALYFPPGIEQTMHTHPSYRLVVAIAGHGECETPEECLTFKPGLIFIIPAQTLHKFRTTTESLTLVIFHPDSDTGFTHQNNPMLNRTFVEGISAAHLPEIQTKMPQ